jgi:hypothetical protein
MPALMLRFLPHLGIATLLAFAGLGLALKLQTGRLDGVRRDLTIERALHETDLANVRAAQAKANADWQAEIARTSQENRRLNDEADHKAATGSTVFADRVMRLPTAAADPDLSRASDMPGADAAPGADRSGGDAILLARADALICAANTARLDAAHDWAKALADAR